MFSKDHHCLITIKLILISKMYYQFNFIAFLNKNCFLFLFYIKSMIKVQKHDLIRMYIPASKKFPFEPLT